MLKNDAISNFQLSVESRSRVTSKLIFQIFGIVLSQSLRWYDYTKEVCQLHASGGNILELSGIAG